MHLTKNKILVAIAFLFIIQNQLFAQNFNIGLGFPLEYPRDIAYDGSEAKFKLQKVYVPITLYSKIRIIPEFGYWDSKFSLSGYPTCKYSILNTGIGIYYLQTLNKTNLYFGPRFVLLDIKNPSENREPHIITSKTDHTYGVTFGAEYSIIKNFSIGFEVQYNYYEINPSTDFGYETITLKRALETVFVFTFHI